MANNACSLVHGHRSVGHKQTSPHFAESEGPWTKIVHMTTVHRPFDVRIFEKECRSLAGNEYEVVLIAGSHQRVEVDGVRIKAIPPSGNRLLRMTKGAYSMYRAALDEQADLYHIHDPELIPWGVLLRRKGHKVVFDMHEDLSGVMLTKNWLFPPLRRIVSWMTDVLGRFFLSDFPTIFAEESYAERYPWITLSETVLNMPRKELLSLATRKRNRVPTIAYIGRVSPQRGSLVTLEAMSLLQEQGFHVRWLCIGPSDSAHRRTLVRLAEEKQLDVQLLGYLQPYKAWSLIRSSHLGIAILHPTPNYYQSYPTKMFEYMALGLPVVASNFPLYRQVIDNCHCGLTANPLNPEEVANAISTILKDPEKGRRMGDCGRRAVKKMYSWEHEFRKLVEFYQEILQE